MIQRTLWGKWIEPSEWEKMSAYHVSGKGLVFVINKQLLQTTIKRQANETGKGLE